MSRVRLEGKPNAPKLTWRQLREAIIEGLLLSGAFCFPVFSALLLTADGMVSAGGSLPAQVGRGSVAPLAIGPATERGP